MEDVSVFSHLYLKGAVVSNMRVVALSHVDDDGIVYSFGEGVYLGDMIPGSVEDMPEPVGLLAALRDSSAPNPCIRLDSGQYVWGCECWWGSVDRIKKKFQGYKFVAVDIDEHRKKYGSKNEPDFVDSEKEGNQK